MMMERTNNGIKCKQFVITLIPIYIRCVDQKHLIRFCLFFLSRLFSFHARSTAVSFEEKKSFLGEMSFFFIQCSRIQILGCFFRYYSKIFGGVCVFFLRCVGCYSMMCSA